MEKNNSTKTKTFEFLTLFTMVIGTVIGSGIYMKNNELLKQTHNPIVSIALWGVVGLVCVLSVAVFIEISSSTKHMGNGTIGNWSKLFMNRKIASFISLFYLMVYVPSTQAFFVGSFIMYTFQAIGISISASDQLMIYLICGTFLIAAFTFINVLAPKFGIRMQVFGTIFKFIPLIIALVAGFILIDKSVGGTSAMFNNGSGGNSWGTSVITKTTFIGGFGAILFSFDGYIYIANAQRDATHKEVVPKALFFGMIFVAIFYVLMALSLFLGSPDGSIQKLFEKMIGSTNGGEQISRILSNVILIIISLLNINVFAYIGSVGVESDSDAGLLYNYKKSTKFTKKQATWYQTIIIIVVYALMIILGFLVPIGASGWEGIYTSIDPSVDGIWFKPLTLLGDFASAVSASTFLIIAILVLSAIRNRKTNKVKVDKVKGFIALAYISSIMMIIFTIFGIFTFMFDQTLNEHIPWQDTEGMLFTIFMFASFGSVIIAYLIQERAFKKHNIYNDQNLFQYIKTKLNKA